MKKMQVNLSALFGEAEYTLDYVSPDDCKFAFVTHSGRKLITDEYIGGDDEWQLGVLKETPDIIDDWHLEIEIGPATSVVPFEVDE
jgi:hypothetical protein